MTIKPLPRQAYPVKLHPWKVMAKIAIDTAKNRCYYMYATPFQFLGYQKKLTRKQQLKLKAHLIYEP